MQHRDEAAMEEGVKNSASVIAIITDGDGQSGCAYFERPFCLKELRWAVEAGKYIQPVIRVEDKKRIGEFMEGAPKDLHFLGSVDFIDLHRGAIQYWDTGVSMIVQRIDSAPKNTFSSSSSLNTEVHSFLNEFGLSQFADKFAELGVSTLEDLQDVDKDMLATDVGLNKLQINKFARNYANVRPASAAIPGGRRSATPAAAAAAPADPLNVYIDDMERGKDFSGLVGVLVNGDLEQREKAANVLATLADDNQNGHRQAIAEAGAIPPLVQLLRDGSAEAKGNAAGALRNLSGDAGCAQAIAEAGAIPLLVQLLRNGSAEAKEKAAVTLGNLSANSNDRRQAIAEVGAIPLLVQLLRDGNVEAKEMAAGALWYLSRGDGLEQAVAEAGAIPLLVQLLRDGSAEAKGKAAGAFANLSCDDGCAQAILEVGAIPLLVQLLRDGSAKAKGKAAGALWYLSRGDGLRKQAVAEA
ncbi:hypothetical protein CYMTET_20666, partial [Cymbomonas tetramitiformis]